ncbi:Ribosomal RNA small subunit methyltransferase E [Fructilactobacillus florum 8D]|uniref:Ribosomal RNA small subunit methyltransferase E n=2 Tax=Fructilactobacillus florum TaxID=640331 RepID=W9EIU5_9LACO|nr:16S rRNA (uracil(1498)-N(3))-methyltransferase [Fructilactobacillus florum]ETO40890.1 Ribosomal RNA small subunit methyltransferase E [Fructilactobacillus florum 8D]KRM91411.1 ribosomal RNA small subunit methyltransferase E [Fructilactobacillus florum DSM 22689 = JCM 16035]
MQHYFLQQHLQLGMELVLPSEIRKHWIQVLRAKSGSSAEFVDNNQQVYLGKLINPVTGLIAITASKNFQAELPVQVTIACGVPKSGKAEFIVQKATELGATKIVFLPMEWSVARWQGKSEKKLLRLQKIAQGAAEQSHRNVIPTVMYTSGLPALNNLQAWDEKLVSYEEAAKQHEHQQLAKTLARTPVQSRIVALFGPEGGISPAEIAQLAALDFWPMGLGPRILRAETAPLYFLSAVSAFYELKC